MPSNDPEYQRKYKQKHYAENKQRYVKQAMERKAKLKEEVDEIKRKPCVDCKISYNPWQMQFDHLADKHECVSILLNRGSSRKKLFDEIAKCEIVCANCHAERTHQRQASVV